MTDETAHYLITVFFIWSYKLATLVIGYLFARLGYSLFLKGVSGEFKFHVEAKGAKADLISASPGLFLILMGTIIAGVGLYKGMTVESGGRLPVAQEATDSPLPRRPDKPDLQRIPPPKDKGNEQKAND